MNSQDNKISKILVILIVIAAILVVGILILPPLIATPIVLEEIDNAKATAAQSSVLSYLSAVELSVATETRSSGIEPSGLFTITQGAIYNDTVTLDVHLKSRGPNKGVLCITDGVVSDYSIEINGFTIEEIEGTERSITAGSNSKTTLNCN